MSGLVPRQRPATLYTVVATRIVPGTRGEDEERLRTSHNLLPDDVEQVRRLLMTTFARQIAAGTVRVKVLPQDGPVGALLPHPHPLRPDERLDDDNVLRHYGIGSV